MNEISFAESVKHGSIGELIFKEDFLEFLNIHYEDVTGCQKFQVIDSDFLSKIGLYEIKCNYKDDENLIIEEFTNINQSLRAVSYGWIVKSKADLIVFISKQTRTMIMLPFTKKFKDHYQIIRRKHELIRNRISIDRNSRWQSAFRKIPFEDLQGFISIYKKIL